MLGYTVSDLDMMMAYVNIASKYLKENNMAGIGLGLDEVYSLLHGLYAEGHIQ